MWTQSDRLCMAAQHWTEECAQRDGGVTQDDNFIKCFNKSSLLRFTHQPRVKLHLWKKVDRLEREFWAEGKTVRWLVSRGCTENSGDRLWGQTEFTSWSATSHRVISSKFLLFLLEKSMDECNFYKVNKSCIQFKRIKPTPKSLFS